MLAKLEQTILRTQLLAQLFLQFLVSTTVLSHILLKFLIVLDFGWCIEETTLVGSRLVHESFQPRYNILRSCDDVARQSRILLLQCIKIVAVVAEHSLSFGQLIHYVLLLAHNGSLLVCELTARDDRGHDVHTCKFLEEILARLWMSTRTKERQFDFHGEIVE